MPSRKLHHEDDLKLFQQLSEGNMVAFDLLYDRHWKTVYNEAFKRLQDAQQAENIAQDVFIKLWQRTSKEPIENVQAYLYTSVRNNVFKLLEYEQRYTSLPDLMTELESLCDRADAALLYKDLMLSYEKLIDQLPGQQRVIFQLRYKDELTTAEIADKLGLSVKTVRNHLALAVNKIRSSMLVLLLLYF